jgi:hypothetical protein
MVIEILSFSSETRGLHKYYTKLELIVQQYREPITSDSFSPAFQSALSTAADLGHISTPPQNGVWVATDAARARCPFPKFKAHWFPA